jgi:hypothetical protein
MEFCRLATILRRSVEGLRHRDGALSAGEDPLAFPWRVFIIVMEDCRLLVI